MSWLSTVDHKKIGIMYGVAAHVLLRGGRYRSPADPPPAGGNPTAQVLSEPTCTTRSSRCTASPWCSSSSMPLAAAFANYLIPLQIGARDVAFPRLNALSFWMLDLAGAVFLNTSWIVGGGGADCGWFCLFAEHLGLDVLAEPRHVDFYVLGLQILGIASLVSADQPDRHRAQHAGAGHVSLFKHAGTSRGCCSSTQFLLLFALPVITDGAVPADVRPPASMRKFFNPSRRARSPLLWQHLFWIFGHPEVYIIILPAFGIVISEIIPTFSRKPIFGYSFMVFSGIAIGFMGWGVWAHHMFVSGIGPFSVAAFSLSTMFIAVPTGVKILNWLGHDVGRANCSFTTAMLYSRVGAPWRCSPSAASPG